MWINVYSFRNCYFFLYFVKFDEVENWGLALIDPIIYIDLLNYFLIIVSY